MNSEEGICNVCGNDLTFVDDVAYCYACKKERYQILKK